MQIEKVCVVVTFVVCELDAKHCAFSEEIGKLLSFG